MTMYTRLHPVGQGFLIDDLYIHSHSRVVAPPSPQWGMMLFDCTSCSNAAIYVHSVATYSVSTVLSVL